MKSLYRLLASVAVSGLLIGLLLHLASPTGSMDPADLVRGLRHALLPLVGAYLLAQLVQATARAARSIILLRASCPPGVRIPGLPHMLLVTLVRGACADMLPARVGELSYIAMLNRGYQVPSADGLSSLSVGLLFDFLALLAVLSIAIPGTAHGLPLAGSALMLLVICVLGLWGLFKVLPWFARLSPRLARLRLFRWGPIASLLELIRKTSEAVEAVRRARILRPVILLSLVIRAAKYTGLYFLFLAVTRPLWPELSQAGILAVLVALIAAEGAASLPVPAFLSFGTYEAGGLAALTALGFRVGDSMAAMVTMHVLSQIIDYSLGGLAFLLFTWRRGAKDNRRTPIPPARRNRLAPALCVSVLAMAALLFAALQYRAAVKRGRMTPPEKGRTVQPTEGDIARREALLPSFRGRIVWSTNRNGLHDIYLATFPEGKIERITRGRTTDTYPRFSPDGKRVAFSRSQRPWVSQRDPFHWDTYVIDLETGVERRIATNATMAVWMDDGESLLYMGNGGTSLDQIAVDLPGATPVALLRSGEGTIPAGISLGLPSVRDGDPWLAVTIRGARRQTALVTRDGRLVDVAGGCQLIWRRQDEYVWVDHPGKMKNAFYRGRQGEAPGLLLDAADDFSHEYFPAFTADGRWLVYGASTGGHEQDSEDYEIFLWDTERPELPPARLTFHTGNDCWPDIFAEPEPDGEPE